MNESTKGFGHILLLGVIVIAALTLFTPIPTYSSGTKANCLLIDDCPTIGWTFGPSLFQRLTTSNFVQNNALKQDNIESVSDWKTYTDKTVGISVKYPNDWYAEEYGSASPISVALTPEPYSREILLDAPRQDGVYIKLDWSYNSDIKPSRQFNSIIESVNHQLQFMNSNSLYRNDFNLSGKQAVTIKGVTKTDNLWTNKSPIHTTYIQLDDDVLIISLSGNHEEIYNQVLSTFELTDKNPSSTKQIGDGCTIGGCNGEICGEESEGAQFSPCVAYPWHGCYKNAICEKQDGGKCGWTDTSELQACLNRL